MPERRAGRTMTLLRAPRLTLRLHRLDDADALLASYSDPKTVRPTPHEL